MATIEETLLQDAATNAGTAYTMSVGDMFEGTFDSRADEDWIRINLVQGLFSLRTTPRQWLRPYDGCY